MKITQFRYCNYNSHRGSLPQLQNSAGEKNPTHIKQCFLPMMATIPLQVVFLDDLGRNVRGARGVGMTAVRVRDTQQALRELGTLLGGKLDETLDSSSKGVSVNSLL